jgi:hypothetical protein
MKNLLYILMIAAVLVSCKKNTTETPAPAQSGEIEFNITSIYNDMAVRDWNVPICVPDATPVYAEIWIQLQSETDPHAYTAYPVDVYYIGDQLYTKALQFAYDPDGENCYRVVGFNVYALDENDQPFIYKATPAPHSEFDEFVVNGLPLEFCIIPFEKQKLLIDVLCFIPDEYELFGFFWFEITEITVREMCFFGDLCLKSTDDYIGSLYEESGGGLYIDEPAIFKIYGFRNGEPMRVDEDGAPVPFSNEDWLGVGDPLCIKYADYDYETDNYEFQLWVLVKVGAGFEYQLLWTWSWQDDFELTYDVGDDGVAEFVVGNCNYTETDFQLPPWMNLPDQAMVQIYGNGGGTGAYFGVEFPGLASGWDIKGDEVYAGWCGDAYHTLISYNYMAELHTSLEPVSNMPPSHLTDENLNALNYLINHYNGYGIMTPEFGPYGSFEKTNIQESVWGVIHYDFDGLTPVYVPGTSLAATMMGAAVNAPEGYLPYPGGFAAIFAFNQQEQPDGTRVYISQLVLILIDP